MANETWAGDFKVAILPCNGIGRLSSTIMRQACYKLKEMRPEQVVLLSAVALTVGEEEEIARFGSYPLVVMDACKPHCASELVKQLGKEPAAYIYLPNVAAEEKLILAGEKRRGLGRRGMELADAVAQKAAEEVDRIIADEMLSTL